jgi:FixJ family two-component response regulator
MGRIAAKAPCVRKMVRRHDDDVTGADAAQKACVSVVEHDDAMRGWLLGLLQSAGLQARAFSSVTQLLSAGMDLHDVASCFILDVGLPGLAA